MALSYRRRCIESRALAYPEELIFCIWLHPTDMTCDEESGATAKQQGQTSERFIWVRYRFNPGLTSTIAKCKMPSSRYDAPRPPISYTHRRRNTMQPSEPTKPLPSQPAVLSVRRQYSSSSRAVSASSSPASPGRQPGAGRWSRHATSTEASCPVAS